MSPGREITAKDIMSGIISAANRKMHRHSKVRLVHVDGSYVELNVVGY